MSYISDEYDPEPDYYNSPTSEELAEDEKEWKAYMEERYEENRRRYERGR